MNNDKNPVRAKRLAALGANKSWQSLVKEQRENPTKFINPASPSSPIHSPVSASPAAPPVRPVKGTRKSKAMTKPSQVSASPATPPVSPVNGTRKSKATTQVSMKKQSGERNQRKKGDATKVKTCMEKKIR